jgi:hypothetical protein
LRKFGIANVPAEHLLERNRAAEIVNGFVLADRLPGRSSLPQHPDQVGPIAGDDRLARLQFAEWIAAHLQKAQDRSLIIDPNFAEVAPPTLCVLDLVGATVAGGFDHQRNGGRQFTGFANEVRAVTTEYLQAVDDAYRRAP